MSKCSLESEPEALNPLVYRLTSGELHVPVKKKKAKRRVTATEGKFDPFTHKHINMSSLSSAMVTSPALKIKQSALISKCSEQMGLCSNHGFQAYY